VQPPRITQTRRKLSATHVSRTIGVYHGAEDEKRILMNEEPDAYQTYVLRLWRAKCQGKWEWRASIESPHTGERHVFASLQQLFAYLSEQCERQVPDTATI
jgi:hypothetical protein